MTRIHHKTFAVAPLDKERDEALSLRMGALDFVGASHLDIPAGLLDADAPVQAMKELHKVNDYKVRAHIRLSCLRARVSLNQGVCFCGGTAPGYHCGAAGCRRACAGVP